MKKTLILFTSLFIIFASFPKNVSADAEVWTFTESPLTKVHTYETKEKCNTEREKFLALPPPRQIITECTLSKAAGYPIIESDPIIVPIIRGGDSTTTDPSKYKMLAPFAGFTEAPENIGEYLNKVFVIAIGLCAALAVLMMIIAGVKYMGEESLFGKVNAKEQIKNALFGLLIALSAYALLNTIDPRLIGGGGLNIGVVSLEIDEEKETSPWGIYVASGNLASCPSGFIDVKTFGAPDKINVCKDIAPGLEKLLSKANDAGIILSGYGTRNTAQQRALRVKHDCPDDQMPSSKCKPPTARPGHSKHESGRAIDFNCNGQTMMQAGGKDSKCFEWLSKNAAPLLKNLNSEPWHWSDDGR